MRDTSLILVGNGCRIYGLCVDMLFSEILIPRDILILFECGKFDSRPGAGCVSSCEGCWSMDGRGLDTRNAWDAGAGGRWGGDTWSEQRSPPRPRPINTRVSVAPELAHSEHLLVTMTASLCMTLWHQCNDIISDTSVLWYYRGMSGGIPLNSQVCSDQWKMGEVNAL